MSLRQLALTAGCPTDEAHSLVQELIDAGVCTHAEDAGYYSPRIVAYETFRSKCRRAGRRGGGNPALRGRDQPLDHPLEQPLKVAPDGSPLSNSLSSFPRKKENWEEESEERARTGAGAAGLVKARTFARQWISEHRPKHLTDSVYPFTKLVQHLGEEHAVEEVVTVELDPTVANPFAVAWSNHDPRRRRTPRGGNGAARTPNAGGSSNGNGHGHSRKAGRPRPGLHEQLVP